MKEKTRLLMEYMLDTYGAEPEYPWVTSPQNAIFRNRRNQKWFAVLLGELSLRCLGLNGEETGDVLNLKCDPLMTFSLIDQRRVFRAYHMNKEHWISVLLDSDISMDELAFLVERSYQLIDRKGSASRKEKATEIRQISSDVEKTAIARLVLESLPDWFGIPEAREEYIAQSEGRTFFAAYDGQRPVGFLYLKQTGRHTAELAVMGVCREYHRRGIGTRLFASAREAALAQGYEFLQVKTVQMGRYEDYDCTNRFYLALGFKEFEVFPTLWDEQNPCQIYVMAL